MPMNRVQFQKGLSLPAEAGVMLKPGSGLASCASDRVGGHGRLRTQASNPTGGCHREFPSRDAGPLHPAL